MAAVTEITNSNNNYWISFCMSEQCNICCAQKIFF